MEKRLYPDATHVLAFLLPKRDAVRWACLCLHEALGANPPPKVRPALEAAEVSGCGKPAALAAPAFWSGGSMTPPGAPVIPPKEHMTAEAVAGAILLTVVGAAAEEVAKRHQRFLAMSLAVASRG